MEQTYYSKLKIVIFLCLWLGLGASAQADNTGTNKVLKLGVHVSGMGNLDPHFAAGSQDRAFADMVFNGLLRYVPGQAPKIEPDLAEGMPEFEIVDNQQIWTVSLRKGIMSHVGPGVASYEITADDVVYSLQKSADTKMSAYAGEYVGWKVSKVSKYMIRIVVDTPVSTVVFLPKLTNYAGGFIVSKKAIEAMGYEGFKNHPIGTGPFKFHKYAKGQKMELRAHENYFRGQALLAGVEMHFYPDLEEREKLFMNGELDVIIGSGDEGWLEKLEKTKNVIVDTFGVGEVATIFFNTSLPPFDDVRVRKAVVYSLENAQFLAASSPRLADLVFSPVPEMFLPGGLTEDEVKKLGLYSRKNLSLAKELLVEAGYEDGFSLDLVTSEKRIYRRLYNILADELAQVGIHCKIKVVEHAEMHRQIRKEPKALVIYSAWRPNADSYLTRFFHSDATIITGLKPDTNFSHYDAIDRLIEDGRLEIRPEKQINLWKQAQIKILSDAVAYPIMYTRQLYVRKSTVNYGHELKSTLALYPQFTENTSL